MDLPVNIKNRVEGRSDMDGYCGFYVTCITVRCDVGLETTLWGLAREVGRQVREAMGEKHHLLFGRVKEAWETGEDTRELSRSREVDNMLDMSVSNTGGYQELGLPLDLGWGRVRSVHSTGAVYCPGIANYLLLLKSTDVFTYNMVHCPGENNARTAGQLLGMVVDLVEGGGGTGGPGDASLADLLEQKQN